MVCNDEKYLRLLAQTFPTAKKVAAEIINLTAILNLPKNTEVFASDVHGEYAAFSHLLKNGAGSVRLKIDDAFADTLSEEEKKRLATLVYYPQDKLRIELKECEDPASFFKATILNLATLCKQAAGKYTRSRVHKALPEDFAYIIEELITESNRSVDKERYYNAIIDAVVETGQAEALIEAMCTLVKTLAIDHLHIVGDIFDRGPAPHLIMDTLMNYHSIDVQWGNHDVVWMGASVGHWGCIAHVVRNCARYGNLSVLEDAYGINILPLATFALKAYADDPCVAFGLKGDPDLSESDKELNIKIQKAMAIIQFKVEAQFIAENPSFKLEKRNLLHKIDYDKGIVEIDGVHYELTDKVFPTIDPNDPYKLTDEELKVIKRLEKAFKGSDKLQRHMRFLLDYGNLYMVSNNNLLFHAGIPLNNDGSLMEVDIFGKSYKGRALYDILEYYVRAGFSDQESELRKKGRDIMWYLWLGDGSPLFAKNKMATFELYLIKDKAARKEIKNPFYSFLENDDVVDTIFKDFGMDPSCSRIVCGHVPVKVKDGEDPVKCNGRVLTIDGGFSKAYQSVTGIAGYTLISNSFGYILSTHDPLESVESAVRYEKDIKASKRVLESVRERTLVSDTDIGKEIQERIDSLYDLLRAYNEGIIKEKASHDKHSIPLI